MKKQQRTANVWIALGVLAVACALACPFPSLAQGKSRAELAAEELVSLSADTIVSFLRKDTGLLLQVKRALVKKAYEQGRMLDARDLEDDVLFRLIQEDQNVRVLITHEIEGRYFNRAKPEDGERESEQHSPGTASPTPSQNPVPPAPENQPARDPWRQVDQAQSQLPADDPYAGLPNDQLSLPPVRPDELSNLLTASTSGQSFNPLVRPLSVNTPLSLPAGLTSNSVPGETRGDRSRRERGAQGPSGPEVQADQRELSHHPNPYADVPSLYDLYSQYAGKSGPLERFGLDVFRNGTGNFDDLPMDMPVGPEYVLGPGDGLSVNLWGGVTQRFQSVVDRQGRVTLPEVGAVEVSGRNLGDVQRLVQSVLRTQFRDVEADVSLSRLRAVRVYVVGDVERPGAYDVSSLSTPLNAEYEAGGPTARGSLRVLRHYRGKQLLQEIDVYDLLLHGIRSDLKGLQPGDTVLVPALGPEVTIEGMVRRPAIYELGGERSLAEVLELAGGVLQSGTLRHIDVNAWRPI